MGTFFAVCYWLWAAFVAVGAGFLGAILNCEYGNCEGGFPPVTEPWVWGDYYVYPEVTFVALAGLVPATVFVALIHFGRRWLAALMLVLSLVILVYPFFAGLTAQGRATFWFGPLLGLAAVPLAGRRIFT